MPSDPDTECEITTDDEIDNESLDSVTSDEEDQDLLLMCLVATVEDYYHCSHRKMVNARTLTGMEGSGIRSTLGGPTHATEHKAGANGGGGTSPCLESAQYATPIAVGSNQSNDKPGSSKAKKAVWDSHQKAVYIELCFQQLKDGDKVGSFPTQNGKSNMSLDFLKRTGQNYTKAQFKNHWDGLRKAWSAWNWLKKQKGLGWDRKKLTYIADRDWWTRNAKAHPGLEKFREGPLLYENELNLFFGVVAQGEGDIITCKKEGDIITNHKRTHTDAGEGNIISVHKRTHTDAGEGNIISGHKRSCMDVTSEAASSQRKVSDSIQFESISCDSKNIVDVRVGSTHSSLPPVRQEHRCNRSRVVHQLNKNILAVIEEMREKKELRKFYSYGRCVDLMAESGCADDSEEWMYGLVAFKERGNRQLYVHLRTPERRLNWLKENAAKVVN